jgi:YHS domain-containing protein
MSLTNLQRQAAIYQALANPKRLEILVLLANHELTAGEIQAMTGFPQANLSQHIYLLKKAHIILATRRGQQISYRITHPNFVRTLNLLKEIDQPYAKKKTAVMTKQLKVKDPVCGMTISPAMAHFSTIYKGGTYYFCASGCASRFKKLPTKYV